MRKKLLNDKQIDFYGQLEWKGKSKRLRKKARKIISEDIDKRYGNKEVGDKLDAIFS